MNKVVESKDGTAIYFVKKEKQLTSPPERKKLN